MQAIKWREKGQFISVNGHQHFVYDSNNNKPYLVILHGYPTCSYDYHKVIPQLEQYFCVVVHDHLGFGFSDKPIEYSYTLFEQTDQALLIWQKLGVSKAIVLAHDYGTSIATELVARLGMFNQLPIEIEQLVLCNGSMHVELAQLRLIQKLLMNHWLGPLVGRLTSKRVLARNLRNIYYDENKLSSSEIDAIWAMMMHNDGKKVIAKTTQYIKQRMQHWHRWIGALQETKLKTHIVWAENDPVAVIEMADVLYQEINNSTLTVIPKSGHFPMLETPRRWTQAVIAGVLN
ncbi:alpha/beta hydrolase [Marinicella sp. S1101]|uniref:alpha/beta fold hydrolase n=1 Tax=Marinicella marina TaxID=2996016 RepID=UPI002260954D|nr:alpha/beta hydrolase [Marinicella marina]MCX7553743.1 alpha/beta hydrolase [Marinicella marina]MDJ1140818.1 alpha/beta hydrolase [Marinicella marina]